MLQTYASQNLVSLKVQVAAPFVQTIVRDRAMTFTGLVASTGGLLGLCLGFSFVSAAEILFHFLLRPTK